MYFVHLPMFVEALHAYCLYNAGIVSVDAQMGPGFPVSIESLSKAADLYNKLHPRKGWDGARQPRLHFQPAIEYKMQWTFGFWSSVFWPSDSRISCIDFVRSCTLYPLYGVATTDSPSCNFCSHDADAVSFYASKNSFFFIWSSCNVDCRIPFSFDFVRLIKVEHFRRTDWCFAIDVINWSLGDIMLVRLRLP